jgi:hypothetical protein
MIAHRPAPVLDARRRWRWSPAFVMFSLRYPRRAASAIIASVATDEDIRRIHARLGS